MVGLMLELIGNGTIEKEYTLKFSHYIHERLDQLGISDEMTRVSDETLEPAEE